MTTQNDMLEEMRKQRIESLEKEYTEWLRSGTIQLNAHGDAQTIRHPRTIYDQVVWWAKKMDEQLLKPGEYTKLLSDQASPSGE